MTKPDQLQLFDNFAAKLRETLEKKGADYATEADVLSNFKTSSKVAKITVLSVIIIEITKKVARIVNLSKKGKIAANEPLEDSILDLCGYAFLLLCAVTEKKNKAVNDTVNVRELEAVTHKVLGCGGISVFAGTLNQCANYLGSDKFSDFETLVYSDSTKNTLIKIEHRNGIYYEIVPISKSEPPTHSVKDNENWKRFKGSYNDCLNYITKQMMRGEFIATNWDNDGKVIGIANDATNETFLINKI